MKSITFSKSLDVRKPLWDVQFDDDVTPASKERFSKKCIQILYNNPAMGS